MSNIIDTRDLHERYEELEELKSAHDYAKENLDDAKQELEEYLKNHESNTEPSPEEVELRANVEAAEAELSDAQDELSSEDLDEFEELDNLKDEIGSEWYHGCILIPEEDFVEYCQELCEDIGDIPKNIPSYIVIDWDATADNLRQDYSEVEYQGQTYLYRI